MRTDARSIILHRAIARNSIVTSKSIIPLARNSTIVVRFKRRSEKDNIERSVRSFDPNCSFKDKYIGDYLEWDLVSPDLTANFEMERPTCLQTTNIRSLIGYQNGARQFT